MTFGTRSPFRWLPGPRFTSQIGAKPAPQEQPGAFEKLLTTICAGFERLSPIGYQDEAGFHYGTQPAERGA